jgi:hypothetical protein
MAVGVHRVINRVRIEGLQGCRDGWIRGRANLELGPSIDRTAGHERLDRKRDAVVLQMPVDVLELDLPLGGFCAIGSINVSKPRW